MTAEPGTGVGVGVGLGVAVGVAVGLGVAVGVGVGVGPPTLFTTNLKLPLHASARESIVPAA